MWSLLALQPSPSHGGGGGGVARYAIYIYICIYIYIYIYIDIYVYICYYTPLPLNLANKQQQASNKQATSKQQALLLTVLAIAPPHCSGLHPTLAIFEPRWWPCQIQVLSQKPTDGSPGRWRQLGRCPPKSAQFWAKNSHFSPKTALVRVQNSQTKANSCSIHVRPDFLVTKGPLVPSNSTICPRNGPKRRQKAPKTAQCAPAPRNQERAVSWATWLKNEFRGHLVRPQPRHFLFSKPQNRPTIHVDPRTRGHLVQPEGRPAHPQWGPKVGPPGSPGRKK